MGGGCHSQVEKTAAMTNGAGAGTGLYFGHMKSEITIRLQWRGQMAQGLNVITRGWRMEREKGREQMLSSAAGRGQRKKKEKA